MVGPKVLLSLDGLRRSWAVEHIVVSVRCASEAKLACRLLTATR